MFRRRKEKGRGEASRCDCAWTEDGRFRIEEEVGWRMGVVLDEDEERLFFSFCFCFPFSFSFPFFSYYKTSEREMCVRDL